MTLLAATVQATPDQPDFSGRWVLYTPALANPSAARRLVVLQPITRATAFGKPMKPAFLSISIRREGASANSEETRLIDMIGGIVPGLSKEGLQVGNSTHEETVWRRDSLVFENLSSGPDGPRTGEWTERRETWSLKPEGKLRLEIETESWNSTRRVDVYFYRREAAAPSNQPVMLRSSGDPSKMDRATFRVRPPEHLVARAHPSPGAR